VSENAFSVLLLRTIVGTIVLVATDVGSVFWVQAEGYTLEEMRGQAFNTLTFGSISITWSASFAYNSAFHQRLSEATSLAGAR
jgi:hypothetical protein